MLQPGEKEQLLSRLPGDRAARARLVESQLAGVLAMASARSGEGLDVGDLFQEGCAGLTAAIDGFSGAPDDFDQVLHAAVTAQMERALLQENEARENARRVLEEAETYERVEMQLARELKRRPTNGEMAAKLEWSLSQVIVMSEMVSEARRQHDEEMAIYLGALEEAGVEEDAEE